MKRLAFVIILFLVSEMALVPGTFAHAAESAIFVEPSSVASGAGSPLTVSVKVRNVKDLYGYQFTVRFDPSILQADSVAEGAFLKEAGSTWFGSGVLSNSSGLIKDIYSVLLSAPGGRDGNGTLASITFKRISSGDSQIVLEKAILSDSNAQSISAMGADSLTAAPAPLPSSGGDRERGGGSYEAPAASPQNVVVSPPVLVEGTLQPQADVPPQLGEIRGRVVSQTGQVVSGATARIDGTEMKTDSKGVFAFTLVHPRTYTVHYAAPGYIGQTQELEVKAGVVAGAPTVILKSAAKPGSAKISKRVQKAGKKKLRSKRVWWKWWRRK